MPAHSSTCAVCKKSIQSGKFATTFDFLCINIEILETSIKRHERYCRSRLAHPAPPRRKSCLACIQAKVRCDSRRPGCGPCQRKGKACSYSSEPLFSREAQSVSSLSPEEQSLNAPTAIPIASEEDSQSNSFGPSLLDVCEASKLGGESGASNVLSLGPECDAAVKVATRKPDMAAISTHLEIPCSFPSRLLQPKERRPAKTMLVNKLASQITCSFAERKMNEATCPPFIHPSAFLRSTAAIPSNNPLVVCQDIKRKFATREAHSDFAVWDAIASEQERIYDQRGSFDKWLHLSSAQSLTIYLVMLTGEGESVLSHHPTLPITLLFTLGAIFAQLHQIHPGWVAPKEQSGVRPTWEDWIFAESKLRTGMVYFILALLFNLEFGLPCDREGDYIFEDLELPAAKTLWEAKDELSWSKELSLPNEARLKYGDLVRFNHRDYGYEYSDTQKEECNLAGRIEKWHKEMDEFGMLVALCSTMV